MFPFYFEKSRTMYNPGLKSEVIESQIPFRSMRCSENCSDSDMKEASPIGGGPLLPCEDVDEDAQVITTRLTLECQQAPRTSIVVVKPRQISPTANRINGGNEGNGNGNGNDNGYIGGRLGGNIRSLSQPPLERFILPQAVDANSDLRRLANSVSAVMTISCGLLLQEHTLQRPGLEEGLRLISDYAHQILTTLLQPSASSSGRPMRRVPSIHLLESIHNPRLEPLPNRAGAAEGMSGYFGGRFGGTSSSARHPSEWFRLPTLLQPLPFPVVRPLSCNPNHRPPSIRLLENIYDPMQDPMRRAEGIIGYNSSDTHQSSSDLMSLVNSLMTTVLILIRVNAPEHMRQHPEREEGLRQMLQYAHQMFNTLLQPPPISADRPLLSNPDSLLHLLYEQTSVRTPNRTEAAEQMSARHLVGSAVLGSRLSAEHAPNFGMSANLNLNQN